MKEQIIQLEPHDDVNTVMDRLGWLRAPRALVILPQGKRNRILQRKLDWVLIQREFTRRRVQFALITDDPGVSDTASELGIPTFLSVEDSRASEWRMRPAEIGVRRGERPKPYEPEKYSRISRVRSLNLRQVNPAASLTALTAVFMALLGILYMIAPSATVTLTPAVNQVNVTMPLVADPEAEVIDFDNALIPARIVGVEVEDVATVETTGSTDVPTQRATGVITFINQIPDEVLIPAGTIVRTTAGNAVRFRTTTDVTLTARTNANADVPIEALEPGVESNLPSNFINAVEGPLASRVRVTNPGPTRGGDIAQLPAVAQEDYDRLRAALLQQLQQRAYGEMTSLITETEFITVESLAVVLVRDETYDRFIGEQAEAVSLEMRVVVQGVVVDELFGRQVIYNELAKRVGSGFEIGQTSLLFRRDAVTQIDAERRVTFVMQGSGDVASGIDTQAVRAAISGKPIAEAQYLLEQEFPLQRPPEFSVTPAFLQRMPVLALRINVVIAQPAP